jgi:hypothetical protein
MDEEWGMDADAPCWVILSMTQIDYPGIVDLRLM